MSFRIFARGTGGFSFNRNRPDEGDVFDIETTLGRAMSIEGGVRAVVENEVTGAVSGDSRLQQGLTMQGTLLCVDQLGSQFTQALIDFQNMTISLSAQQSHMLWPTTGGVSTFRYTTRDSAPFRQFLRDIHPALEASGLNGFMVLLALAEVFSLWALEGSEARNGLRQLNIQLTAT